MDEIGVMANVPSWADEGWSEQLPVLRSRGEGQDLEYMREFPENTRELAKEIAAFATSNSGTILIGVSDDGELVGVPDGEAMATRDLLCKRLSGVCTNAVKPSITPDAKFAVESGKTVLVIVIPRGSQPVYYQGNTPYLRHLSAARPAEPHEVIDLVRKHIQASNLVESDQTTNEARELYSELARILINVLLFADQSRERMVNPWLDMWRSQFEYAASDLRRIAAQDVTIREGIDDDLRKLAESLDEVASLRMVMGCGPELMTLTRKASTIASDLKQRLIDTKPLGADSVDTIRRMIKESARRLKDLVSRSDAMVNAGRIDEFQSEASRIGQTLLELSFYDIDQVTADLQADLRRIGRELHIVETEEIYMDGGVSLKTIQDKVTNCSDQLQAVAGRV